MKRVAALWLPMWSIDRICRAEPTLAPPPEPGGERPDLSPLAAAAAGERARQCDAPRNSGWRPGAKWARHGTAAPRGQTRRDIEMQVAALPAHRRPPMRMLGRASEAADPPFRGLRGDDGRTLPQAAPIVPAPAAARPPLVIVHKVGSRVEVVAVSTAAAALGIGPGMALTQVRAAVPEVIVREADPGGDAADLKALAVLLARRWTPVVAVSDADGLLLDMTGVSHLHGGEARFARRLVKLLAGHGFAACVAIADTAGAAWALARHGGAAITICPPAEQARALAPLPAVALRLDERALTLLRRLGVETVAEVAALPRAPFARRFGRAAARRIDQALGHAPEPLDPVIPPESVRVEQRFAEPIASAEAIAHWLGTLVPRLTQALAEAGLGARALTLAADRVDGVPQVIRLGFARPSRDPAHILRLIARRIEEVAPGYGIDALALHVRRAEPLGPQPFDATLEARAPDLGPLIDTLANRAARTWRSAPIESVVPERSIARVAPLDLPARAAPRLKRDDVRRLDARPPDHPWTPARPRPVKLLRRPERLDHVIAELPDQPPRRFTWRGVRHIVVRADGPERIAGEWWRRAGERDAVRDYFRVEDESGQRFWLFRRGDGERAATGDLSWYLHGRFG